MGAGAAVGGAGAAGRADGTGRAAGRFFLRLTLCATRFAGCGWGELARLAVALADADVFATGVVFPAGWTAAMTTNSSTNAPPATAIALLVPLIRASSHHRERRHKSQSRSVATFLSIRTKRIQAEWRRVVARSGSRSRSVSPWRLVVKLVRALARFTATYPSLARAAFTTRRRHSCPLRSGAPTSVPFAQSIPVTDADEYIVRVGRPAGRERAESGRRAGPRRTRIESPRPA